MELNRLVPLVIQLSIILIVLSLGLKAQAKDLIRLWHRPSLLVRSVVALNLVVPILAMLTVVAFQPVRPVGIALVLLAISPVPPFLPQKLFKLSSDESYIYGLLVTASLVSILFVPAALALLGALLDRSLALPAATVLRIIGITVLAPLSVGAVIARAAPRFAARSEPLVAKIGMILLGLALILILAGTWRAIWSLIGNGTVLIIALVVGLTLAAGHLLGGPDSEDRVVLALAAAARHPGVALAIASHNFPEERSIAAAVLLYLLLNGLFSRPYTLWWNRKKSAARTEPRHDLHRQALSQHRSP